MKKRVKIKAIDLKNKNNPHILKTNPLQVHYPLSAARDSGGERQGHCMKHEAVMGALVKWLLSSADR